MARFNLGGVEMKHTTQTVVEFSGKTFFINIIEDMDYLMGLVRTDDDVPFWAVLWPAALGMAEYFWESVSFEGQSVLELGAGLGLVGIVAAAKGASLIQTDFIPEAVCLAKENANINGINNISNILADWRSFQISEKFDWIVGSDILYEPKLHGSLKSIFQNNLKPGGIIALADPGRGDAQKFIEGARGEGYAVKTITKEVFDSGRKVEVTIYLLTETVQRQ